jgi:hypothetical protein
MAKAGNSLAARLRNLESALERAKKVKRGAVMSAEPMRELLRVSWPTLRQWCRDIPGFAESGAFVGGGNGVDYEFKPVATVKFLLKHFRAEQDARLAKAREVRRLVGAEQLAGLPDDIDIDELRKVVQLQGQLIEARVKAGELVDAEKVRNALAGLFTKMQQAGVKAASEQDPTGQWPPEIRESFDDAVSNVLVTMGRAGEEALRSLRGRTA